MSEQAERETELVAGSIGGITQKKADTWTVAVTPEGSQYAKNLWTKDADLVDALSTRIGQHGAFVCSASIWTRNDGTPVRSLWIKNAEEEPRLDDLHIPARSVATPVAAAQSAAPQAQSKSSGEGMSKEEWARKDSAIHMMAAIKAAADALKHTIPSDPTPEDLNRYLQRCKTLSWNWWQRAEAVRKGDDSDVPFLSEHDEAVPF